MAHELPDLPYDHDGLEPYLSIRTLQLHHGSHHQGYVDALNEAEAQVDRARESGEMSALRALCDALAFNYSGHMLHSLYWRCMSPDGGGAPSGALAEQIDNDFDSFGEFRARFVAATTAVQASGWGVLVWQPVGRKLVILQAEKHQDLAQWACVPVMVVDVWEHAYYLDYANERARYVEGFFDVADWEFIGRRFERA